MKKYTVRALWKLTAAGARAEVPVKELDGLAATFTKLARQGPAQAETAQVHLQ